MIDSEQPYRYYSFMPAAEKIKRCTYADYLTWPDEERWELIDGTPYNMSPAPSFRHQRVAGLFFHVLEGKLKGRSCTAGIAPTDVVLSDFDVVQPDVFVVCDKKKITDANIQGAPDLVIEVLSPTTTVKDRREKKALYEKYGVVEYIIADPVGNAVERFLLKNGKYNAPEVFGPQDTLLTHLPDNVAIPLNEIFA